MTEKLEKYAIIDPWQINEYHKKGYEFLTVFSETWINSGSHVSLSGSFMNNPVSLSGNIPTQENTTKFLMVLNSTGEVLFGAK